MKVLITGVTSRMIGSTRLRYDYLSNVSLIQKALEIAGHKVEVRKVDLDEKDVSKNYDVALVGLAHIYSLGAGYYPQATRVLHEFGERAALYCDDWACVGLGETLKGVLRGWDRYLNWRKYAITKEQEVIMHDTIAKIARGADGSEGHCAWPMLLPMFSWGNIRQFMEGNLQFEGQKLEGFDPTSLYITPGTNKVEPRDRKLIWTLAVLQNHDQWLKKLNLRWPVLSMGNKRKGEQVLSEKDVVQHYANNWGVLAPKYPKAGTGWWRVRYVHAADTGAIMLCDPQDGEQIGLSYEVTGAQVEAMKTKQLLELANSQHKDFFKHVLPPELIADQVSKFVENL
jgi:hypothetical protein